MGENRSIEDVKAAFLLLFSSALSSWKKVAGGKIPPQPYCLLMFMMLIASE